MKKLIAATLSLATLIALGATVTIAAEGAGSCGKGKVFNPDTQSCVAKPKSTGSGSHSG